MVWFTCAVLLHKISTITTLCTYIWSSLLHGTPACNAAPAGGGVPAAGHIHEAEGGRGRGREFDRLSHADCTSPAAHGSVDGGGGDKQGNAGRTTDLRGRPVVLVGCPEISPAPCLSSSVRQW